MERGTSSTGSSSAKRSTALAKPTPTESAPYASPSISSTAKSVSPTLPAALTTRAKTALPANRAMSFAMASASSGNSRGWPYWEGTTTMTSTSPPSTSGKASTTSTISPPPPPSDTTSSAQSTASSTMTAACPLWKDLPQQAGEQAKTTPSSTSE